METSYHSNRAIPKSHMSRNKLKISFMKSVIIILIFTSSVLQMQAQDVNRKFGVGLQSAFPTFGLSAKYAITDQSVVQATLAPFGTSVDGASFQMNFYGARYIHRFPGNEGTSVVLDPYVFGGVGLISYTSNYNDYFLDEYNSSESVLGYSVGGGIELIFLKKLGWSLEAGYGKMSISGGIAVNTLIFGSGIHFYIK
jgi:hypothetical protein